MSKSHLPIRFSSSSRTLPTEGKVFFFWCGLTDEIPLFVFFSFFVLKYCIYVSSTVIKRHRSLKHVTRTCFSIIVSNYDTKFAQMIKLNIIYPSKQDAHFTTNWTQIQYPIIHRICSALLEKFLNHFQTVLIEWASSS